MLLAGLGVAACGGGGSSSGGGATGPTPVVAGITVSSPVLFGQPVTFTVSGSNLLSPRVNFAYSNASGGAAACTARADLDQRTDSQLVLNCEADELGTIRLTLTDGAGGGTLAASADIAVNTPQVKIAIGPAAGPEYAAVTVTLYAGSRTSADTAWARHFLHYVSKGFYNGTSLHLTNQDVVEAGCYLHQQIPLVKATQSFNQGRAYPARTSRTNGQRTFAMDPRYCDQAKQVWSSFAFNVSDNTDSTVRQRDSKGWAVIGSYDATVSADNEMAKFVGVSTIRNDSNGNSLNCPFPSDACYWPDWRTAEPNSRLTVTQLR